MSDDVLLILRVEEKQDQETRGKMKKIQLIGRRLFKLKQ